MKKLSKFTERLLLTMTGKKVTQKQLAEYLLTTQQTVSRWIQGVNEPDYDAFIRICFYLDVEPGFMLGYEKVTKRQLEFYEEYLKDHKEKRQEKTKKK